MARPPSDDPSRISDSPDTAETAPPTESYRQPPTLGSGETTDTNLAPGPRSKLRERRSDSNLAAPEVEDDRDERPTVLSINTTQRSADEPLSQGRIVRDDGRMSRLEDKVSLLDARVRLAEKNAEKFRRLTYAALTFLAAGLGYALSH